MITSSTTVKRTVHILSAAIVLSICYSFSLTGQSVARAAKEINRFSVAEAKQAVAVDKKYFYVINNSTITKHDRLNGDLIASWDGRESGVTHLNSGVVVRGKLYCASSNYPESPMASSIEIFDAATLKHTGNHSFGIFTGSATWIYMHSGSWYVGFAHYTGTGSSEGKDTRWTSVVKFDKKWRQTGSWTFPENVIREFMPQSNSGAVWDKEGRLYCTGHAKPELYVLEIPRTGYTLKYIETIQVPVYGQGIAVDRQTSDRLVFYGIKRSENLVIEFEIR